MFVGIRIPYTICSLDTYSVYELFFWNTYSVYELFLFDTYSLYDFNIGISYTAIRILTYDFRGYSRILIWAAVCLQIVIWAPILIQNITKYSLILTFTRPSSLHFMVDSSYIMILYWHKDNLAQIRKLNIFAQACPDVPKSDQSPCTLVWNSPWIFLYEFWIFNIRF